MEKNFYTFNIFYIKKKNFIILIDKRDFTLYHVLFMFCRYSRYEVKHQERADFRF